MRSKRLGLNAASREFGISKATIRRHLTGRNKYAQNGLKVRGGPTALPDYVEKELVQHIKNLDDMFFGMNIGDLTKLAFEIAESYNIKTSFNKMNKKAGKKWYYGFMRRHPELKLRTAEAISLSRISRFNRKNVYDFFEKYT